MEAVAVAIFHKAATAPRRRGHPLADAKIDPYAVGLDPGRWEEDGLFSDSGLSLADAQERTQGIDTTWMEFATGPGRLGFAGGGPAACPVGRREAEGPAGRPGREDHRPEPEGRRERAGRHPEGGRSEADAMTRPGDQLRRRDPRRRARRADAWACS